MYTEQKYGKREFSTYATAALIFFAGLGLLLLVVYYIAFLPVPAPLQSLKVRVLTMLQLEQVLQERPGTVTVSAFNEELDVFGEPEEEAEVVGSVEDGVYEKVDEKEGWVKIRSMDRAIEGWIKEEHVVDEN